MFNNVSKIAVDLFILFSFRYGSPIIFKPPETSINLKRHAAVDGSKYDVYTLGLLALDMFTQLSFSNEISKKLFVNLEADYWSKIMYPYIFRLLQVSKKLTNFLQIYFILILIIKHISFIY